MEPRKDPNEEIDRILADFQQSRTRRQADGRRQSRLVPGQKKGKRRQKKKSPPKKQSRQKRKKRPAAR